MIQHKKLLAWGASAAIGSMLLAGCSGGTEASTSGSDTPQAGGNLVIAREADVVTLLPTEASDNQSIWTIEELYDTLLVPSVDGVSQKPSLATEWVQSPDKLSWTFTLRKGVTFSDGTPLTSADVKFSLETASQPDQPLAFINEQIASIETPAPETVVIKTKIAWAPLPSGLALFANSIVPNNYGGKTKEAFAAAPVGSGPFKLKSWSKGQQLELAKNTNYWGKDRPYLDTVTFTAVADANTRASQLQGGQIGINENPAASSIASASTTPGINVGSFETSLTSFLSMNNTRAPFSDVHVRRAIAYAIDREAILKAAYFGQGTAAGSFLGPSYWAYEASVKGHQFNLDEAKKELAQSSQPQGFSANVLVTSGNATELTVAQILQSELAQIGITLSINQMEVVANRAARKSMDYDLVFTSVTTDITDPDETVRFVAVKSGGSNAMNTGYDSKEVADLVTQAASLSDEADRKKVYSKLQEKVNEDQPLIPLFYLPSLYTFSDTVHDFHPSVTGNYNLVNTWMSK
ncbi:ABC transporter substrate-binding protein [Arthrobacter sp. RHLT1-20]